MKTRVRLFVIGLLVVWLVASVSVAAWIYWEFYGVSSWQSEVYALQGVIGTTDAMDDFRNGHLRLYRLDGESDSRHYTGANDGPFEIWNPQFYPLLGPAHRYSTQQFIEFYNRKMRYMHEHRDEFLGELEEVQPDEGGNSE